VWLPVTKLDESKFRPSDILTQSFIPPEADSIFSCDMILENLLASASSPAEIEECEPLAAGDADPAVPRVRLLPQPDHFAKVLLLLTIDVKISREKAIS
jgi:hypothetical protein